MQDSIILCWIKQARSQRVNKQQLQQDTRYITRHNNLVRTSNATSALAFKRSGKSRNAESVTAQHTASSLGVSKFVIRHPRGVISAHHDRSENSRHIRPCTLPPNPIGDLSCAASGKYHDAIISKEVCYPGLRRLKQKKKRKKSNESEKRKVNVLKRLSVGYTGEAQQHEKTYPQCSLHRYSAGKASVDACAGLQDHEESETQARVPLRPTPSPCDFPRRRRRRHRRLTGCAPPEDHRMISRALRGAPTSTRHVPASGGWNTSRLALRPCPPCVRACERRRSERARPRRRTSGA